MGSKPSVPKPPPIARTIGEGMRSYISTYGEVLPQVIGLEQQYRPEFLGLNLADIATFLQGADGQQGLYGISRGAAQEAGAQLAASRAGELGTATGQAGMFRQFVEGLSPEQAAAVQAQQREAQRAEVAARGLTPQEQRMADQQARESFGARGMLGSTASLVGEAMGRENILAAKRQEAAAARGGLFDLAGRFYTAPGMSYLTSAPTTYSAGMQTLGLGLGAIGSGVPQMISPDVGANLGMVNQQNITAAQAAQAQARASQSAGIMGGLGALGGGLAQGAGAAGGFGALFALSDRRAKHDIKRVGTTDGGLPVYTFKYNGSNTTQMGVMAQDVEKKNPNAVVEINGVKAVNYSQIQ